MTARQATRKTLRAAIAFALTYLMVWGGVPAPALAEMVEEAMGTEPVAAPVTEEGTVREKIPSLSADGQADAATPGSEDGGLGTDGTLAAPDEPESAFAIEGATDTDCELGIQSEGAPDGPEAEDATVAGAAALSTQTTGDAIASGTWGSCPWEIGEDGKLTVRPGTGEDTRWWSPWIRYSAYIRTIVMLEGVKLPVDSSGLFQDLYLATSVQVRGIDTSKAQRFNSMFSGCSSLATIDLSGWDTSSVTNMSSMFAGCKKLSALAFSGWNTSNVKEMSGVFYNCSSLSTLDISSWSTSSANDMSGMFEGCSSLATITGVEDLNTAQVARMSGMFYGCESVTRLDLSGWDTSSLTVMGSSDSNEGMFQNCRSLTTLDLSGWDVSKLYNRPVPFEGCSSLSTLNLSGWKIGDYVPLFRGCSGLVELNLSGWDTSSVQDMSSVFAGCSSIASLDLSGWNTSSAVDMSSMFSGCASLESVSSLNGWNTVMVTNMSSMFSGCASIADLSALQGWKTQFVADMSYMFYGCASLKGVAPLEKWKTGSVNSMEGMFSGCSSLEAADLSEWDTSQVVSFGRMSGWGHDYWESDYQDPSESGMFSGCSALGTLDLSGWSGLNLSDASYMFYGCSSLVSVNVENWNTANLESVAAMFYGCASLEDLDLSGWDTESLLYVGDYYSVYEEQIGFREHRRGAFSGCASLRSLNLSGWDVSSVSDMTSMFSGCKSLKTLDLSNWKLGSAVPRFCRTDSPLSLDLSGWDTSSVTDMTWVFSGCSLASLDLSGWDTSSVTDMSRMFSDCSLASLDLSGWDTSSVTSMREMFEGCASLASLDLSDWDLTKLDENNGSASSMFSDCPLLETVDLSGWRVGSVIPTFQELRNLKRVDMSDWEITQAFDMNYMFYNCEKLEAIDGISGLDTSQVTSMYWMFYGCASLTELDLSRWNTEHVTDMNGMFLQCRSLRELRLSTWNTANVENMEAMFVECDSLKELDLSGWNTSNANCNAMFYYCGLTKLTVGEGFEASDYAFHMPDWIGGSGGVRYPDPEYCTRVWSTRDKRWYWDLEVFPGRNGVADTYLWANTKPCKNLHDVPYDAWYTGVVYTAVGLGLMSGYPNGRFGPADKVTRGQVAVILWNMAGNPAVGASARTFPDVGSKDYYYNAVRWASSKGVVSGYGNGRFGPKDNVTREQLAAMLANFAKNVRGRAVTGSAADFASMADRGKVSSWAVPAVGWCFRNKILSGSGGNVNPGGTASRAEAAKMVVGLYDQLR